MQVSILYFASLRERLGTGGETLVLPPGVASAGALREWLRGRGDPWSEALAPGRAVRVAVDRRLAADEAPLADGAEVAFFPPVTGG